MWNSESNSPMFSEYSFFDLLMLSSEISTVINLPEFSSHNFDKYPGLKKRRKSESNLFKAGLNKIKDWLKS